MRLLLLMAFALFSLFDMRAAIAKEVVIYNFRFDLPKGYSVTFSKKMADFYLMRIGHHKRNVVGVYVGGSPKIAKDSDKSIDDILLNSNRKYFAYKSPDGVQHEEVLVRAFVTVDSQEWTVYGHAWMMDGISDAEVRMARKILDSMEPRTAHSVRRQ